jgi:hypothetical protein
MGVWGTGIFQDDNACDIRDDYRDYLGAGLEGPAATARILEEFKSMLADPVESSVVWLALAAVQWKHGRLESETLQQALLVIDSGRDLNKWEAGTKDFSKRKSALERMRAQITSPQPAAKKVAHRVRAECGWQVGDLVAYTLLSQKLLIFRVIGHHTDKGGTYPTLEIMDWSGNQIPSKEALEAVGFRTSSVNYRTTISKIMLVGLRKKSAARLKKLDFSLKPSQTPERSSVVHFKEFDEFLKKWFQQE